MTQQQKEYIEQNIELIEVGRWEEFFDKAPYDTAGLGSVLYEAEIDFLSHMKEIPSFAFYQDDKLQSFIIPDNIQVVNHVSFWGCENLINLTIPNSVKKFVYESFKDCKSLTHVVLPDSILEIGPGVFEGCINLKKVTFEGTIQQWQRVHQYMRSFKGAPVRNVHCIDGVTKLRR